MRTTHLKLKKLNSNTFHLFTFERYSRDNTTLEQAKLEIMAMFKKFEGEHPADWEAIKISKTEHDQIILNRKESKYN